MTLLLLFSLPCRDPHDPSAGHGISYVTPLDGFICEMYPDSPDARHSLLHPLSAPAPSLLGTLSPLLLNACALKGLWCSGRRRRISGERALVRGIFQARRDSGGMEGELRLGMFATHYAHVSMIIAPMCWEELHRFFLPQSLLAI